MDVTDFSTDAGLQVRDCPAAMLTRATLLALHRFCAEVPIWQETLAAIDFVADQSEYTLTPVTAGAEVHDIVSAKNGTRPMWVTSPDDLLFHFARGWEHLTGDPQAYYRTESNGIRLFRTPEADSVGALTVRIQAKPSLSATTVPDYLHRYHAAITHGTLAELLSMKDQPWTNYELAAAHGSMFTIAMGNARAEVATQNGRLARGAYMRSFV